MTTKQKQPGAVPAQDSRAYGTDVAKQEAFLGIFRKLSDRIAGLREEIVRISEYPELSGSLAQGLLDAALDQLNDMSEAMGEFLWTNAPTLARAIVWQEARNDALYDAIERLQWHAEGTADSELAQAADAWLERLCSNDCSRLNLNYWSDLHDEAEEFWYANEDVLDGEDDGFDLERAVNRCYNARLREADGE